MHGGIRRRVICARRRRGAAPRFHRSNTHEGVMSKGMNQKKGEKKPATKTLKEKRAAKQEKKQK
jgi:hypothetical protein